MVPRFSRFSRLALEPAVHLPGGRDQVPQRGLGLGVAAGLQPAVGVGPQPGRADDADRQAAAPGRCLLPGTGIPAVP
jgi:hypothetical protein